MKKCLKEQIEIFIKKNNELKELEKRKIILKKN